MVFGLRVLASGSGFRFKVQVGGSSRAVVKCLSLARLRG